MKLTLMLTYMKLFLCLTASLIQERELDLELNLDQTKERDNMLSGFFQQPILKASNRNSPFSQKKKKKNQTHPKMKQKINSWMTVTKRKMEGEKK